MSHHAGLARTSAPVGSIDRCKYLYILMMSPLCLLDQGGQLKS